MIEPADRASLCSSYNEPRAYPSILTLATPDIEDIARAIWERQHDELGPEAVAYHARWRDPSIPSRFWNEFLLDANAVLAFLYNGHVKYNHSGNLP